MRSTPEGEHRPVMLDEVFTALDPQPGQVIVDGTVGFAGHAAELLARVGPTGRLIGLDLDADNLPKARARLDAVGHPFALHHGNFAGLAQVLAAEGLLAVDAVLADVGVSSMQIDDPDRGFSYSRDGPLDMRMDRSRGKTAAQLLNTLPEAEIARALREYGDEPQADAIAAAVVAHRPLERTRELAELIARAAPVTIERPGPGVPTPRQQRLRPAARVFQALRILVNRELANLAHLLRVLPDVLKPGGRAAVISFHSGEDRLVKQAFREGLRAGVYAAVRADAVRASEKERVVNPRSRSAKLRWARRA
jgi:16S rRNA (cytosine1402-N4)-methyltransferase